MRKVKPPTHQAKAVFETCIGKVKDPDLKARLSSISAIVEAEAQVFAAAIHAGNVHLLPEQALLNGDVEAKEMEAVYTGRMAKIGAPGRLIYDELMAAPVNDRCPLCGQRTVSTLDH